MRRMSFPRLSLICAEFWLACFSFGANVGFWLGAILFGGSIYIAALNLAAAFGSAFWVAVASKRSSKRIAAFYDAQIKV